jgi:hypothetical protein
MIDVAFAPNISVIRNGVPQSAGDFTPAGGGRYLPSVLKKLTDEAFRRPVGQADLTAALANPQQLGGCFILVGREHDAEGRDHDVEGGIGKR